MQFPHWDKVVKILQFVALLIAVAPVAAVMIGAYYVPRAEYEELETKVGSMNDSLEQLISFRTQFDALSEAQKISTTQQNNTALCLEEVNNFLSLIAIYLPATVRLIEMYAHFDNEYADSVKLQYVIIRKMIVVNGFNLQKPSQVDMFNVDYRSVAPIKFSEIRNFIERIFDTTYARMGEQKARIEKECLHG